MSRIYVDSNIYIYYFNRHPVLFAAAELVFRKIRDQRHLLQASLFTLAELLVLPTRTNDHFKIASTNLFFRSPAVTILPFSSAAAPLFASLRAQHRLKPLDAIHLACAATAGVDLFLTNDQLLTNLKVPGIGTIAGLQYDS